MTIPLDQKNVLLLLWLFAVPAMAARKVPWHDAESPYRGVFRVHRQPTLDKCGIFLRVPVCGLGDANGSQVRVFDSSGEPLPAWALGASTDNTALVVCDPPHSGELLFAYWGGRARSPQARGRFVPGPTITIRAVPDNPQIENWDQVARLLDGERLGVVAAENLSLSYNPIDSRDAFLLDFRATIQRPKDEEWSLFLVSDDAGYLFVNDKLVIARNGRHHAGDVRRGENRQTVPLQRGLNDVRVVVVDAGGEQMALLARWYEGRAGSALQPEDYLQSGVAIMSEIACRDDDAVCPAFTINHRSYVGLESHYLTEVELISLSGARLAWRLDNGVRAEGTVVRCLLTSLASLPLRAAPAGQRQPVAQGLITFAQIPQPMSWQQPEVFEHYTRLIVDQDLLAIAAPTLQGYLALLSTTERNPQAFAVAQALISKPEVAENPALARQVRLELGRTGSTRSPESVRAAYREYLRGGELASDIDVVAEYFEFELYFAEDYSKAAGLIKMMAKVLGDDALAVSLHRGELALMQGELPAAHEHFDRLRAMVSASTSFTTAVVQANALLETMTRDLADGRLLDAEAAMRAWPLLQPGIIFDGSYVLQRARWLRRLQWYNGALSFLSQFTQFNDLPAFLPELEFEKGLVFELLRRPEEAKAVFTRIAKEFPKHPLAARARAKL